MSYGSWLQYQPLGKVRSVDGRLGQGKIASPCALAIFALGCLCTINLSSISQFCVSFYAGAELGMGGCKAGPQGRPRISCLKELERLALERLGLERESLGSLVADSC